MKNRKIHRCELCKKTLNQIDSFWHVRNTKESGKLYDEYFCDDCQVFIVVEARRTSGSEWCYMCGFGRIQPIYEATHLIEGSDIVRYNPPVLLCSCTVCDVKFWKFSN